MRHRAAVKRAKELASQQNVTPIELAGALWDAEKKTPGSLAEIIEKTKLGRRKAYYLVAVWKRFAGLNISKKTLAAVGWTKLAIVAKHAAVGEERAALDLALQTTAKDLPAVLRGETPKRKMHSILLRLGPKNYREFAAVLQQFGATQPERGKGLVNKERALMNALRAISSE